MQDERKERRRQAPHLGSDDAHPRLIGMERVGDPLGGFMFEMRETPKVEHQAVSFAFQRPSQVMGKPPGGRSRELPLDPHPHRRIRAEFDRNPVLPLAVAPHATPHA